MQARMNKVYHVRLATLAQPLALRAPADAER